MEALTGSVAEILEKNGFEVYFGEGMRKYFDIIAVGNFKIFVKVLANIDNIGQSGSELKRFSEAFCAKSVIVGEKAGTTRLRDGVIYRRDGNSCMSLRTFEALIEGEEIHRFTKRGQILVAVDGEELRRIREERGLTREELGRYMECSGRAIGRIERHNRIREELIERLTESLGKDLRVSAVSIEEPCESPKPRISDPLKKSVLKEYFRLSLESVPLQTPIDFALEEKPLLTPVSRTESELRLKQRIAKGLEDILECRTVHITKEKRPRRLACISFGELHSISSKDEILEME